MRQFQEELRRRLPDHGWRVTAEVEHELSGEGRFALQWHLSSTVAPLNRQVQVEFRVLRTYVDYWAFDIRQEHVIRFDVAVCFPHAPDGPRFEHDDFELTPRTFFRALEWFRDPTGHNLYQDPDGWLPPDTWNAERWRAGAGVESAWGTTAAFGEMLRVVKPTLSERKLRLVGCAIARRLPEAMLDERNQLAVETAERYAEGAIPKRELKKAARHSDLAWLAGSAADTVEEAVAQMRREDPVGAAAASAEALREVVADPFRTVTVKHLWLRANGGLARRILEGVVANQDYAALPVLADALEDAGCGEAALLGHLRQDRPHAPGCWAADLLLGRS
ncbi:MAG: hypothetical protein U0797_25690 [Gemmataceae bacterium]